MVYRLSIGVVLFALFIGWFRFSWLSALFSTLLSTFGLYLVCGGWQFVYVLVLTFPRDVRTMWQFARVMKELKYLIDNPNLTVAKHFNKTVEKYGDKVAFIFEDKQWTFKEVDKYSNQVANYFQSIGYKKGDVVALFMENRPEMVFFWLGLSKIGVISALINYNLKKAPLIHCISIVNSKGLVYSADPSIAGAVSDIQDSLKGIQLFKFGSSSINELGHDDVEEEIKKCSEEKPAGEIASSIKDCLYYIYTSGTTGYPKACVIAHQRFFAGCIFVCTSLKIHSDDILYNVLPLYHTQGGLVGVGSSLLFGVTVACSRKFSASRFWEDCAKYRATWTIYVGELCRYLLSQAPKETEKRHSLRFIYGNGLRPQIWETFQERFNIPHIRELYAATEGNAGFINMSGYPGAVGSLPTLLPESLYRVRLFKMDPESGELLRGPDGFCVPCKRGEVGQAAGKILGEGIFGPLDGYVNKEAFKKKIGHDLVKKGDQWFLTGDSLYWDELGYLFFHDRLGDTFRWRSENVSTTEVEGIIIKILGLNAVVVFGVEVPGCEGRAGMAVIEDPNDVIDVTSFGKRLSDSLPSYARPIFLRITTSVDTTGTYKFKKTRFGKEGFDVTTIPDKLFYLDEKSQEYRSLTKEIYEKFQNGEMRI